MNSPPIYYKVLYDYENPERSGGYLKIKKDDIIEVIPTANERNNIGWMTGTLKGATGLFPTDYATKLTRSQRRAPPPPLTARNSIDSAPWYWGDISKKEVAELMIDSKNGTFLVRNSTNKEENAPYTLTLRKDCKNMLIKIYHSNGKYDIIEPPRFNSVEELIRHYSNVSLAEFNNLLNFKLQDPLERLIEGLTPFEVQDIVRLRKDFKELCRRQSKLEEELKSLQEKEETLEETYGKAHTALDAYNRVISMYRGHECQTSRVQSFEDVKQYTTNSLDVVKDKINSLELKVGEVKIEISESNKKLKEVRLKLGKKENEMTICTEEKDYKERLLLKWRETRENIAFLKEGKEVICKETVPHLNESLWLFTNCTRDKAENLLRGKPAGTFLIRHREADSYALSIVSPDEYGRGSFVYHCIIDKKESGYGFSEPFYIYERLIDLVLHHKESSLIEHNEKLNITLKFPVNHREFV